MVRWGMGDFKKWGGILVMRDDFEMGGEVIPLYGLSGYSMTVSSLLFNLTIIYDFLIY